MPVIRPEKAQRCKDAIEANSDGIKYEIIADVDTERIGAPKMVNKLASFAKYDEIMFLGDDTIPTGKFLVRAQEAMESFNNKWGLVGINDNIRAKATNDVPAHWLAHKKILEHTDGEYFHEGYRHCFCDNELTDRVKEIDRFYFCRLSFILHDHPIALRNNTDDDYNWAYSKKNYIHDMLLYRRRRANNWTT
jgi:hypothetical protein